MVQESKKDDQVEKDEIRKYVKFKVEIDLSNPIVSGWTLDRGSETHIWIGFEYERLKHLFYLRKT